MVNYLAKVKQFHKTFKQPVLKSPTLIDEKRFRFRIGLLEEELQELTTAYSQGDKTEILDALCDLQYVLSGAILELGFGKVFDEAFQDVHDSNMSKACISSTEAQMTVDKYMREGVETYFQKSGDKFLIYRTSDGKVLKSINYQVVDLKYYTDDEYGKEFETF